MTLSIIIINYNTFELTCNCIHSIRKTASVDYELILVDNNSQDHPAEDFLVAFPDINLISLKENVGFGRANNIGAQKAKGKYLLLLNSDAVVHPSTIDQTVGYLEEQKNIDVLGCKVLLSDGTVQPTVVTYNGELSVLKTAFVFTKRNAIIKEVLKRIHGILYKKAEDPEQSVIDDDSIDPRTRAGEVIIPNFYQGKRIGGLAGVYLLIKKNVYLEAKGFDPDFFMYYEELEWFVNRLRRFNIVYYPFATITHFYGKSDVFQTMTLTGHLSSYLFWYKMSYWHFGLYFLYNLLEVPSRIILGALQFQKSHFEHVSTIIKAIPYILTDIPRYSNKYGARKTMLKTK